MTVFNKAIMSQLKMKSISEFSEMFLIGFSLWAQIFEQISHQANSIILQNYDFLTHLPGILLYIFPKTEINTKIFPPKQLFLFTKTKFTTIYNKTNKYQVKFRFIMFYLLIFTIEVTYLCTPCAV